MQWREKAHEICCKTSYHIEVMKKSIMRMRFILYSLLFILYSLFFPLPRGALQLPRGMLEVGSMAGVKSRSEVRTIAKKNIPDHATN